MVLRHPADIFSMSGRSDDDKCTCCEELVGEEDSAAIVEQLKNREKNCMWCGDDFGLTEEEIGHLLADNTDDDIDITAARLNEASRPFMVGVGIDDKIFDIEGAGSGMDEHGIVWMKKDVMEKQRFEEEKKRAIKSHFGIDTDKEKFDPGYADSTGKPYDRINDAIPYEEIHKDGMSHRLLKCINDNPNCTAANIKRKVKFTRVAYYARLPESPLSRLYASKLIDCESTFAGFMDFSALAPRYTSGYFGKIPRFNRKYFITPHGEGVLTELKNGRKEVLIWAK